MAWHNDLGKAGEQQAAEYLQRFGYEILERNYRAGHQELDIIARDGNTIVFVEVKTRRSEGEYTALGAITRSKCLFMIYAANDYLVKNGVNMPIRFDVVTVIGTAPENFVVKHYPRAFNPYHLLRQQRRRERRYY